MVTSDTSRQTHDGRTHPVGLLMVMLDTSRRTPALHAQRPTKHGFVRSIQTYTGGADHNPQESGVTGATPDSPLPTELRSLDAPPPSRHTGFSRIPESGVARASPDK